jgi:predicted RNA-binding Zn ribbon-like protein
MTKTRPTCLLFANTVEAPISDHPLEFLGGYADLASWGWHAGLLGAAETERLRATAEGDPKGAAATFRRAMALRDAIDRLFRAVARSATPAERDLARVREEYAAAVAHARLLPDGDAFAWSWEGTPDDLGRPLWPVARSAFELLTGGDLRRVKECPGAGDCGWLFYDTSRNGARRWCSMEGCGSRVKMRRHYARHRAAP